MVYKSPQWNNKDKVYRLIERMSKKTNQRLLIQNFRSTVEGVLANNGIYQLGVEGRTVKDLITFDKIFIEKKSINEITKRLSWKKIRNQFLLKEHTKL